LKKISPYLLVVIGLTVIILGLTGSFPKIIQSVGQRLGLINDLGDLSMGFSPLEVSAAIQNGQALAPEVGITQPADDHPRFFIATPTPRTLAPHSTRAVNNTPAATATELIPTPTTIPSDPSELEIPSIGLVAPIIKAEPSQVKVGGEVFDQWKAPDKFAVGWHSTSAMLGKIGNTVLNGHHNINGKVFENLHKVVPGDEVIVYGGSLQYTYVVVNVMILPERNVDLATRQENARWILPSTDERLTLITCWPATSNTHRLIVVAQPITVPRAVIRTPVPDANTASPNR
jgi:sortase A